MNKKTIIIIGATSGIGKTLFEKFAADGNHVGIVGRRTYLLEKLREQYPANTLTATADITKTDEAEKAICDFSTRLDHVDLAIVCSGMGEINPTLEYSPLSSSEATERTMTVCRSRFETD